MRHTINVPAFYSLLAAQKERDERPMSPIDKATYEYWYRRPSGDYARASEALRAEIEARGIFNACS